MNTHNFQVLNVTASGEVNTDALLARRARALAQTTDLLRRRARALDVSDLLHRRQKALLNSTPRGAYG